MVCWPYEPHINGAHVDCHKNAGTTWGLLSLLSIAAKEEEGEEAAMNPVSELLSSALERLHRRNEWAD